MVLKMHLLPGRCKLCGKKLPPKAERKYVIVNNGKKRSICVSCEKILEQIDAAVHQEDPENDD